MRTRRAIAAFAAVAGILTATMATAAPASAASRNGVIESGEFVLWLHSNYTGALFDDYGNEDNYSGHYFINSTAGLNDNASSIANYDSGYSLRTYYHSNYTYPYISVLPYGQASGGTSYAYYSLGSFNDELSSHLWF
ncbi:peptidase inhibitor family I36 protein [Phytohabitans rumicis]|uniref:peptidase inhibitor family I36 protein n=1 Tax=Phytohabitans rumicis TaxID=1076125 RepID=UPI0031E9B02E